MSEVLERRVDLTAFQPDDLPAPPTDDEKYWYLGRQYRWIFPAQLVAFGLVCVSLTIFSLSSPWLYAFLVPLALYIVTNAIGTATSMRRGRFTRATHEAKVHGWLPDVIPSVDVFLPSAGEPLRILENTFRHVSKLQWPGTLTVLVLDDSARPDVQELARDYGFEYLSRPDAGHLKKAGNLKYGLEHSSGDLIAIFDADFVPRPDYLFELVPYFDDQKTAIVQSPQFFDAANKMHWLQRSAASTQELFYRWIQPSRDRDDAAICVGTCAIYRREALAQVGGFAQIGHSEDVHTGVNLMKAGYHLRYVPVNVSKGLCPDTVASFLNQQYRWCSGSMSLLVDPMFRKNPFITQRQQMSFWAGFLYYITTAVNAVLAPLPVIIMLWFLPEWIRPANSAWLIGVAVLWFAVLPSVHKSRWRLDTLRVQHLYSFAHLVAITDQLRGKTKGWVATGAAPKSTSISTTVQRVMHTHTVLAQALIWTGLILDTARAGMGLFWAMWIFAALNAYVVLPTLVTDRAALQKFLPRRARHAAPTLA